MIELDAGPFFTRGVSADLDLMAFPCTEDHRRLFYGAVSDIVAVARKTLSGCSDKDVRDIMSQADQVLIVMVEKKLLVDSSGEPYTLNLLRKQSAIQCLPVACMILAEAKESTWRTASKLDSAGIDCQSIQSPAHVCLAIALAHAVTAIHRLGMPEFYQVGVWHAMVASEAMGVFYLQGNDVHHKEYLRSQGARKSASARWARLDTVKALAFRRRQELSHLSRSAAINQMQAEILDAARDVGEPLTGGNPKRTIEDWFRKAEIR